MQAYKQSHKIIHILDEKTKFCDKNLILQPPNKMTAIYLQPNNQHDNMASNSNTIAIYLDTGSFLFFEIQINGKKVFAES